MTKQPGVALILGPLDPPGRALSHALAGAGYALALQTDAAAMAETSAFAAELRGLGIQAAIVTASPADAREAAALIEAAGAAGPVTAMINNCRHIEPDRAEAVDAEAWDRHFAAHARAPALLAPAFAAALPEGAAGSIIHVIDHRGWRADPAWFSYSQSQAALWSATRALALGLAPRVRVNALRCRLEGSKPAEIAAAALYLLGAGAVTGQVIAVDDL